MTAAKWGIEEEEILEERLKGALLLLRQTNSGNNKQPLFVPCLFTSVFLLLCSNYCCVSLSPEISHCYISVHIRRGHLPFFGSSLVLSLCPWHTHTHTLLIFPINSFVFLFLYCYISVVWICQHNSFPIFLCSFIYFVEKWPWAFFSSVSFNFLSHTFYFISLSLSLCMSFLGHTLCNLGHLLCALTTRPLCFVNTNTSRSDPLEQMQSLYEATLSNSSAQRQQLCPG